ncbi:MAG TPA: hypothetical protein VGI24_06075 [Solirubrobacteraceae bacterium]|jgi:streptogramin lyase
MAGTHGERQGFLRALAQDGAVFRFGEDLRTGLVAVFVGCLACCAVVCALSPMVAWGAGMTGEEAASLGGSGASGVLGGGLVIAGSPTEDEQLGAQRQARHDAPEAFLGREESQTEYEGLDPAQAAGVAKSVFPGLIDRSTGGAPELPAGERIVRYPTDRAAEVALPEGQRGIVESLAPIAVSSGREHLPIELRLQEAGAGFAPARSNLTLGIPMHLEEGVSLAKLGVSLTPVGADGAPLAASEGALDGAAAVWHVAGGGTDGAQDLESVAKATPGGFDLTSLLLSERSPGELYFHVGLPAGARLVQNRDGSIGVLAGGKPLATIAPVAAEDAEGNGVPVSTVLHGSTLEVSLDLEGEYRYPIAVDPELLAPPDSKLAEIPTGNWEFKTSSSANFQKVAEKGVERLETKGIGDYNPSGHEEIASWGYQTKGVSHIYKIETQTSGHNKGHQIESFLAFFEPGGARETKKSLSNESLNPEYENKAETACAANASKVEECLSSSGKANNAVVFEQAAIGNPGSNYGFSDWMTQGVVSIAEPSGTHSTTSYNTSSSSIEVTAENEKGEKEKVKRTNALLSGAHTWLSKLTGAMGGAIELQANDGGIGVSATKLEYESAEGVWTPLEEHNYLAENGCQGVQCYSSHNEAWILTPTLPNGEDKLRYKAEEAIAGTQSLSTEGVATVKVDTKKPHGLKINGLPGNEELSEGEYHFTVQASDGEGSIVSSSGIKTIELRVDGSKFGTVGGSCTAAKGECTASNEWTVNGAELGAGKHGLEVVALDNAGNEANYLQDVVIRHSTPVTLGPGSVDLQSGDFTLGPSDVSVGSGLTVSRDYSSRDTTAGDAGVLGPEWSLNVGAGESLTELPDADVMLTAANGAQTIFASLGAGKFEAPLGDSNLVLKAEENEAKTEILAYYLENPAQKTKVKFERVAKVEQISEGKINEAATEGKTWVPTSQEGAAASGTVQYSYAAQEQQAEYTVPGELPWPEDIAAGVEGNLWFTEIKGDKIGKINSVGTMKTYSVPSGHGPRAIARGAEGDMWFTENVEKIGKVTPSGTISEYALAKGETAESIAAGPNGNMWYTTNNFGERHEWLSVGEIQPSGYAWSFRSLHTSGEESDADIAAGPAGSETMWVSEYAANKICKITVSGEVSEYSLPAGSKPTSLAAGSDGNIWFAEGGTKKIGKMSPGGTILAEYALVEGGAPEHIIAGAEGDLWFTHGPGSLSKITTSGTVTVYDYGMWSQASSLAAGTDGQIWFTQASASEVGAAPTSGPVVRPTEELAPHPEGVSCSPELKPGCRALFFKYSSSGTAKGEAPSEWGTFRNRLEKVVLDAYSPATKAMQETTVAEYTYDKLGRLRAEWDPRISPSLKTTYGYDEEGHVSTLAPPGQEPWMFTYGTASGDKGTGRLLKATRASASTELWSGTSLANSEAPKVTGLARAGVRLAVSNGAWSGSPEDYGYQWERCTSAGVCSRILGATNANYTPSSSDVGDTLEATVTAINGGGSAASTSVETATVQSAAPDAEYVTSGKNLSGLTVGPEAGTYWFGINQPSRKLAKITTSGAVTEYPLPSEEGSEIHAVTKGPEGNLWYTNSGADKIGKMTPSGTVTQYALAAGDKPYGIVSGPDGNLWFASTNQKIGKITPAGVITEYTVKFSSPSGIIAGPDGNLWVAASNDIDKVSTTGTITEYEVPSHSDVEALTTGPDGNIWFVDYESNKVGKITTSGAITEYSLPSGKNPYRIIAAQGSLWVTSLTGYLYRVSTSGTATAIGLPAGSQPSDLATSGEELWFRQGSERIHKLITSYYGEGFSEGEAKSPQPGITMEYNIPVAGSGAPHEMSEGQVAMWGQRDDPAEATAVFPMDEPQSWPASSYVRATVYYLDEQGRQVNVASPSRKTASPYGSISTTEYNRFNDVIRTLTPDNREAAMKEGCKAEWECKSAEVSKSLDTQSTYNGEGAKEEGVSEPGTRLLEVLGPEHEIRYHAGSEVKERAARNHEELFYDQGAPGGETYDLVTEKTNVAKLSAPYHEEVDERTTKTSYSGQSNLGWKLRAPTSVTVDPGGAKLTTTTEYNATKGELTEGEITEVRGAGAEATFGYATKFGETGSEAGKLKNPWGVAVNSEGKLWVVDSANSRVEEFSSSGSYIAKFGEAGTGTGKLKEPEGIALDSAGDIWVADTGNNRLEEFSASGAYITSVGSLGTEAGKLKAPAALTFDAKGNPWVADTGNNRVEKFSKEGTCASKVGTPECVSKFGVSGSEPGQLSEPKGIAIDAGEHVWVADTGNNRVQEFSTSGVLLKRFGSAGSGEGQLKAPIDLKIDGAGDIWTVDSLNGRAQAFTPSGAFVTQIGWKGVEAGQLTEPHALAFDATGKIWVSDGADNRLEQWSKGPNAHDEKTVYYSVASNSEYSGCGSHPEWAGLVCETLPAKQPELMALPKLPTTTYTYNMYDEPETTTETFGSTTRTKKDTFDAAGRRTSSETTATTGVALPKVTFSYNSTLGMLEKETSEGEGKTLTSEYNRVGQRTKYTDSDGNVAKFSYGGPSADFQLETVTDSSDSGTSEQEYKYDGTTRLATGLTDSAAGAFTATYDTEGKLVTLQYPYSMCASYSYNAAGEAVNVNYLASTCKTKKGTEWYGETRTPGIHGETLSQVSTLGSESYAYDTAGRLTETQESPAGEGCSVRAYAYDEEGNRTGLTSRTPGTGGVCQGEGGTVEAHNYDESGRLADAGIAYNALGDVTKLPAADAEGHELTSTFYADNAVASQTQSGVTNEYKLDPEGRTRETITGSGKTISHYDGPGEAVAWTESPEKWVRNIYGLEGALIATQTNGETPVLQLHDLQGDVVATIGDKEGETKLLSTYSSTEFGVPNAGKAPPKLAWAGALGVESSFTTGVITYGATSYVPQVGMALQSEQVEAPGWGGGSGRGAAYTMQEEPWVMQGALRAGAEALQAAQERAAAEAASTATGSSGPHDPLQKLNRAKAREVAEELSLLAVSFEAAQVVDLPGDLVEIAGGIFGESFGLSQGISWLRRTSEKLTKCANNTRGLNLNICRFRYWEESIAGVNVIDFGKESDVSECREERVHGEWELVCYYTVGVPQVAEA